MTASSERARGLPVLCALALVVGVVAGLGAWAFRVLIGFVHNVFFLQSPAWRYDANAHTSANPWGWLVVLVPVAGSVLVVWLVKTFAPEARGHGVPEVVDAIHYDEGRIRPAVAIVKSLASAICIGSGGSVGREGPIIQIGAAFGSTLGQIVRVPARQRITLIAAGAAGGIAATFNAPLGGVVFAIELLLVSINVRNLLPVAFATVTANYLGQLLLGTHPAFDFAPLRAPNFHLTSPWQLVLFVPLGLLVGLMSVAFVRGIYWAEDRFDALPGNEYTRHAAGMLAVGGILYAMWRTTGQYYLEGVGYATIMDVITGTLTNPGFLLALCALKLVTTGLTLGSGGSGGVFSPALFMGAALGASFGHVTQAALPGVHINEIAFTLAGMAAAVGAATGAMITATVMLLEMTDDNNVVLPLILTTVVACAVRKAISPESVYTLKLLRRGHVVPDGLQAALDDARHVRDVMQKDVRQVPEGEEAPARGVTAVIRDGKVVSVIHPYGAPEPVGAEDPDREHAFVSVLPGTPLLEAMREMQTAGVGCALVFSRPGSLQADDLVGAMTLHEVSAYRARVARLF